MTGDASVDNLPNIGSEAASAGRRSHVVLRGTSIEPSYSVIEAVAEVTDREPEQLEPLYGAVDPDALDNLFGGESTSATDARIEFRYEGCEVVVDAGRTRVTPVDSA